MENEMNALAQPILSQTTEDWWRGAVIYQIYPRSFQDSTGSGIGDLRGIVQRLPYIAALGVDAIWISPFFTSPMEDFGYDVSDFRDVDPMFGTLDDFDAVIKTAHDLGVKVLIDLVFSHTSSQHPWFKDSRKAEANAYSDYYVWADPKPDGTPPNNWLSIFGGSAWQWDARRCQYYLHNFLTSQPDLNFHNPIVQVELLEVARFWLERGVNGFRLDTINFYCADQKLRDNPALPKDQRNDQIAPSVNPYNHQEHIYDKNRPETLEFLRKLRALMDGYNAAAVGEVGDSQRGLEILGEYTAGDDLMQMCYAFELLSGDRPTADTLAAVFNKVANVAPHGGACWAYSNHDVQRHKTRWHLSDTADRCFITMLMCLRGSACIYQGEELALPEAEVAFEALQDPYGIEFWPEYKGRDGCRTPMVWEPSNGNGGFSSHTETWLPVPQEHLSHAAATAEADANSLLHHYRRAIAFRKTNSVLQTGEMADLLAKDDVFQFTRSDGDTTLFCAFNLGEDTRQISLPKGHWQPIGRELGAANFSPTGAVTLSPWQVCLALKTV